MHHFYLFLSDRTVIVSNHLFDIGLVTLSIGAGYIVIMRVIRLLARRLLPCCTLPGLLGMCSVLANNVGPVAPAPAGFQRSPRTPTLLAARRP